DDRDSGDEIIIERIAFAPETAREPGKFYRPRKEAEENGDEIKRQRHDVTEQRSAAMTFHRDERSLHDMMSNSDTKKFAVRAHERGNSPNCHDGEHNEHPKRKKKPPL